MPQPDPAVRLATREAAASPQREWGGREGALTDTQSERRRERGAQRGGSGERQAERESSVYQRPKPLGPHLRLARQPGVGHGRFFLSKSRSLQLEPRASPLARKHSPSGVTTLPALPRAPSGGGAEARKAT